MDKPIFRFRGKTYEHYKDIELKNSNNGILFIYNLNNLILDFNDKILDIWFNNCINSTFSFEKCTNNIYFENCILDIINISNMIPINKYGSKLGNLLKFMDSEFNTLNINNSYIEFFIEKCKINYNFLHVKSR